MKANACFPIMVTYDTQMEEGGPTVADTPPVISSITPKSQVIIETMARSLSVTYNKKERVTNGT